MVTFVQRVSYFENCVFLFNGGVLFFVDLEKKKLLVTKRPHQMPVTNHVNNNNYSPYISSKLLQTKPN